LVVIMISLPIKLFAFITMNKQGWLTRTSDQIGGEGQSASTLTGANSTRLTSSRRPETVST
jgi:N-acetylglucosaminyltransferase